MMAKVERVEIRRGKSAMRATIERNQEWLELFSPAERRKVMKRTFELALNDWRQTHLKKRVQRDDVLAPPFNYAGKRRHSPMVRRARANPNEVLINAMWRGKIRAQVPPVADDNAPYQISGTVAIPFGHPVTPEITRVFSIVPPDELEWLGEAWGKRLLQVKDQAMHVRAWGEKPARLKLSPGQRESLRRQPRRAT
jgi:hypothetical protein